MMSSSLRHHKRGAGWRDTQSAQSDRARLCPLLDQSGRSQTKSGCPELRRSSRSRQGAIQPLRGVQDFAGLAQRGMELLPTELASQLVRSHSAVADRPFHKVQWVQINSVVVNRRLSLASIRQEQSMFFQPSNILYVMK